MTPSAPSVPAIPQIAGAYFGPTTDVTTSPAQLVPTWSIKFTRAGDASPRSRGCDGGFVIQQTGASFAGSFFQGGSCPIVNGQISSGTVQTDGTVTLSLTGLAADPLAWTDFAQCAPVVNGTTDLTGKVSGNLLDASFARDALIDCPNDGFVTINVRLRGSR